jgi:ATP-binding cassette subfamily B (MDR/TAP) protein 10
MKPGKEYVESSGEGSAAEADERAKEPETQPPSLSKLFRMARPELPMLAVALLLMILAESTGLVIPLIIANAYDALVDENIEDDERMNEINGYMTIALTVYAAGTVAGFLRAAILGVIGERMVARMRYQLYASILRQEIGFFDEHKSGELVSRLGSDTTLLQQVISQSIPEALLGVIKTLVAIGLMFWIAPSLAGVSIGSVFIIFAVTMPLGQLLGRLAKDYQNQLGEAQTYSTEAFGSMRTVQSFAAEEKEVKRYGSRIGNPDDYPWWYPTRDPAHPDVTSTYRVGFSKSIVTAAFYVFIFGAGFGFLYISLWYGFYLVNEGEISLGDLTAFQSFIFTIGFGLGGAASHFAKVFEGLGASGRVFFLLERVPAIPKPQPHNASSRVIIPASMKGDIEFKNVTFSYPSRPNIKVLNDFSLRIPANTTTALVGSSGSGKSTVVSLLQRFYDIQSGSIEVDGQNLQDLDLKWLRTHIGFVQQEPALFGLSCRENLLYGVDRKVSQEELEKACRDANAYDFISSWPDGFDTLVGEKGIKMSGGQKQRVAIARALLTDCRILLLDEATSALDAESEHLVQEAINKAVEGRTVIIVAHRLSTIQRADQIVVMSDRKIVDRGSHEELLRNCTHYRDLIKRQSMTASSLSFQGLPGESL